MPLKHGWWKEKNYTTILHYRKQLSKHLQRMMDDGLFFKIWKCKPSEGYSIRKLRKLWYHFIICEKKKVTFHSGFEWLCKWLNFKGKKICFSRNVVFSIVLYICEVNVFLSYLNLYSGILVSINIPDFRLWNHVSMWDCGIVMPTFCEHCSTLPAQNMCATLFIICNVSLLI